MPKKKAKSNKKKKKSRVVTIALPSIILFVVLQVFYVGRSLATNWLLDYLNPPQTTVTTSAVVQNISDIELTYDMITKSNILIQVNTMDGVELGSGTIIDSDDTYYYAITCYHVIDAEAVYRSVTTYDGIDTTFTVVAMDPDNDLALIQFEKNYRENILPLLFYNELSQPGDNLLTIGNPGGSVGSIYAVNFIEETTIQELDITREVYSIDIELQPGMSGGALVTHSGQLVGINTAVLNGITYSIPASVIYSFLNQITY